MSIDRSRATRLLMHQAQAPTPSMQLGDGAALVPQAPLFQQLVGTCPLLIVADGPDQSIIYASPAFEVLSGYSWSELGGRDWRVMFEAPRGQSNPRDIGPQFGASGIHGTLSARHKSGATLWLNIKTAPQRGDCGLVTHHILMFHDVTAEYRARETLEYRAHHDPLTGIANRHLLCDRFQHAAAYARRHASGFTLALIDLDGFKLINDRFGHDAGDAVLRCVALRLEETVRGEDTVARLGGDEFCLLLAQEPGHSVHNALNRITEALAQPVQWGAEQIPLSCSIGSSEFPDDGRSLQELLKSADLGLYAIKALRAGAITAH